jgi:hypothetical protein
MLAMSSLGTCSTEVAYSGRKTAMRVIGPPAFPVHPHWVSVGLLRYRQALIDQKQVPE